VNSYFLLPSSSEAAVQKTEFFTTPRHEGKRKKKEKRKRKKRKKEEGRKKEGTKRGKK
jgi:hypothetical protein